MLKEGNVWKEGGQGKLCERRVGGIRIERKVDRRTSGQSVMLT